MKNKNSISLKDYLVWEKRQKQDYEILEILNDKNKMRVLVYGQVQSGKTQSIIEILNKTKQCGYDFAIVLGGINEKLNNQTINRLKECDFLKVKVIDDQYNIDEFDLCPSESKMNVFVKMKEDDNLKTITNLVTKAEKLNKKFVFIDDESDHSSVNKNRGKQKISTIYQLIEEIYSFKGNVKFFNVTATPYANIYNNGKDHYRAKLMLTPGDKYCGSDAYIKNNKYLIVDEHLSDKEKITLAYITWLLSTFFWQATRKNRQGSEFVINNTRINSDQKEIYDVVCDITCNINSIIGSVLESFCTKYNDNFSTIQKSYIDEIKQCPIKKGKFDAFAKKVCTYIQEENSCYILNSNNKSVPYNDGYEYAIIIGGDIISRGLTIRNLITMLFLNDSKNVSTLLQKCRWFGYREQNDQFKYINILTTNEIYEDIKHANKINTILFSLYPYEKKVKMITEYKDVNKVKLTGGN